MSTFSKALCLSKVLVEQQLRLAVAESCTGGFIARTVTDIVGASGWFEASFVTYSNEAKMMMLGVSAQSLAEHTAVSAQVAQEMAVGVLEHSRADVALSVTGVAGPGGGSAQTPVGCVWYGLARRGLPPMARCMQFRSGRVLVQKLAAEYALDWLLSVVSEH